MTRYRYTDADNVALAFCNDAREEMGKKPARYIRKGVQERVYYCPIAKTIEGVTIGGCVWGPGGFMMAIPEDVVEWIDAFDAGKLPHFIEGEKG